MPTNTSRNRLIHIQRKWYESGAIKQPVFPKGSLVIDCAHAFYSGPMAGKTHLILGMEMKVGAKPLCEVIVPTGFFGYDAGVVLEKLPANAVPVSLYPDLLSVIEDEVSKEIEEEVEIPSRFPGRLRQFLAGTGDW